MISVISLCLNHPFLVIPFTFFNQDVRTEDDMEPFSQLSCLIYKFDPYPNDQEMEDYFRDEKLKYDALYELALAGLLNLKLREYK